MISPFLGTFNPIGYYSQPHSCTYHQQSRIEIHSPESEYLESIGYDIQQQTQEEKTTQLQEQIVLLQSLCEKITQEVELPA